MNPEPSNTVKAGMRKTLLTLAALVAIPVAFLAAAETEHVTRTARLAPDGTLKLKNFSGRVTITGSDRRDASIDAVRRGSRDRLDHVKLDIHEEGSTLVVDANKKDRTWFSWHSSDVVETDFDIAVPRRTNLEIDVFSSPVSIEGVEGSQRVHAFSSRVRLDNVSGPVTAHSFSGPIEITERTWKPNQTITVDTFSGNIRVRLPDSARGAVTFDSFSGRLNSALPLTLHSSSRRSLRADLGGDAAGGSLRFKTFSGSVDINR